MTTDPRAQFGPAAERYVGSTYHAAGPDLAKVVAAARLTAAARLLDVATGGGHTALRCAPFAGRVVAYDLTRDMLDVARRHLSANGAANIEYCEGAAAALPFAGGSFDALTCRQAAHHFPDVAAFCREAVRVVRPGGRVVIVDTVVPGDPLHDAFFNGIEVRRDPSHARDLPIVEWAADLRAGGAEVIDAEPFRLELDYDDWTERMRVPLPERAALARDMLAASAALREHYAIRAGGSHGVATFEIDCAIITAERPA